MPKAWTGKIVGRMHVHDIKLNDLAEKFDFSASYLGMILHGQRNIENAESRINAAIDEIIKERKTARQPKKEGENKCQRLPLVQTGKQTK